MKRKYKISFVMLFGILAAGSIYYFYRYHLPSSLMAEAHEAFRQQDYARAEQLSSGLIQYANHRFDAAKLASNSARRRGRLDVALRHLEQVLNERDAASQMPMELLLVASRLYLQTGRAGSAERYLRQFLKRQPQHVEARDSLLDLLGIEGRRWEANDLRFAKLRQGRATLPVLLLLSGDERVHAGARRAWSEDLHRFRDAQPDDPYSMLGEAITTQEDDPQRAEQLLRTVVGMENDLVEAHVRLGKILLNSGQFDDLAEWHDILPESATQHPEIWVIRGHWYRRQGSNDPAVRCFWEAIRRDPMHQAASNQLATVLASVSPDLAVKFQEQARHLESLTSALNLYVAERGEPVHLEQIVASLEHLGRYWEAAAWCRLTLGLTPKPDWAVEAEQRLVAKLTPDLPQIAPQVNLGRTIDLSGYPLPLVPWQAIESSNHDLVGTPNIRFDDRAAEAGIHFTYYNAADPLTEVHYFFDFTGGGVAVLDYDQDSWPDLYFTQGSIWPRRSPDVTLRDRLYRNLGDGSFEDVTTHAGLGDEKFSQGVAVGDINNDGAPDLWVSNLGENRLYVNQADGTFDDVSTSAGIAGNAWTTSAAIADLDSDGLSDIYVVNYLRPHPRYGYRCDQRRRCSPTAFDAAQDQIFINRSDGTFEDWTIDSGTMVNFGKGLGVVVADFDSSGRLGLFVANDTTANLFFFVDSRQDERIRFRECAALRGLALDRDGKAQAGMGVAADDYNRDGFLDLFVTNFHAENNTLYENGPEGLFLDVTRRADLAAPSYSMLGFGTQFIDADLDGNPDLVVANGHVEDYPDAQVEYQMRPQFFWNRGDRFVELEAASVGDYFGRKLLGRGLARGDLNRDGREDFVVSHLEMPVALLENTSPPRNHFLAVQLRATQTSRDAVGTRLQFELSDGRRLHRQLTAGDGYHASNQRQILVGLGTAAVVSRLDIHWPSGNRQSFDLIDADQEVMLIEGNASWHHKPK